MNALPPRLLPALALLWPALATAQPTKPPVAETDREFLIAATEQKLWLVSVSSGRDQYVSRIFQRGAGVAFNAEVSTSGRIVAAAALDDSLLAFFDDDSVYRYTPDQPRPLAERVLPEHEKPLDAVGATGRVYAIIDSEAAKKLPLFDWTKPGPTSQPFSADDSALSLVVYDGRDWAAAAPLPRIAEASGDHRLDPKLCVRQDGLLLFINDAGSERIACFALDQESRRWMDTGSVAAPRISGFWAVETARMPTLVIASGHPTSGEALKAYRLFDASGSPDWRPTKLRLSELPPKTSLAGYQAAVGFNQHIALLARESDGKSLLRFASPTGEPAEVTIPLSDEMANLSQTEQAVQAFQLVTMVLLIALLMGLFVFRRGSMVNEIALPRGCATALSMQRLVGWLVDFAPFAIVSAVLLEVRLTDGLSALARWGVIQSSSAELPSRGVFVWWALSIGGYTTYALVMELIARRTVGKVVARVHLISESGGRPKTWQIVVRNATRLVELLPQFWIFAILVILSRNRQRVGDIFARTIAIRLTQVEKGQPAESQDGQAASDDAGDQSDQNQPQ